MDHFTEITKAMDQSLRLYIDQHARTPEERYLLTATAGKSLVMLGASFLGNALGIADPTEPLAIGEEALRKFQQLARKRGQ